MHFRLKKHQCLNSFMALIIGVCNQSVTRMRETWTKLPVKYKNMLSETEKLLVGFFYFIKSSIPYYVYEKGVKKYNKYSFYPKEIFVFNIMTEVTSIF